MKKFILLFTILTLTTMTSCEKDEKEINMIDNIEEGIVGTWRREIEWKEKDLDSIDGKINNKKQISDRTFNPDLTYSYYFEFYENDCLGYTITYSGIYKVDNENKIVYFYFESDNEYESKIITLTDKKLVFDGQEPYYRVK